MRPALESGTRELPFGSLEIQRATPVFSWAGFELYGFRSAADYEVRGLRNRYRQAGIGAPLAARLKPVAGADLPPGANRIGPNLKVPVTALLRIERPREELAEGRVRGQLEVYSLDDIRAVLTKIGDPAFQQSLQQRRAADREQFGMFDGNNTQRVVELILQ